MGNNYLISIKSSQKIGQDNNQVELTTLGNFEKRKNKYYISYEESEATGMRGVLTTLKVEGDKCVTLSRSGAQVSRMVLEKGQRHMCYYDTGYGDLMVGVFAQDINNSLKDDGGEINLKYTLDIDSFLQSNNEINISVKKAGK